MNFEFFTTDDGVKLGYMDQGSGIPVILLAGYSAPATSWYREEKTLLQHGYRVIAFDRRSHGSSENPAHGQDMATQGRDIDALIRHLQIRKAFLVGQSQGASCMWSYISQFGTEHLYGVISIDQTPKMINDESWPYGMTDLNRETRPAFFDKPLPTPNKKSLNLFLIGVLLRGRKYLDFDRERTKPLLLDHADADWRETIRKTDVPVLFVAGEASPFWPREHAAVSAALCPKGESAVVAGSGHAVNQAERKALWTARHNAYYAGLAYRPGCRAFTTDVCVPISRLAECIAETKRDLAESSLVAPILGHVGDGNFHMMMLVDPNSPEDHTEGERLHERLVRRALAMGGTITGEHGIGMGKQKYMKSQHGAGALALMCLIKQAIDPDNLMNPGKMLPPV